MRIAFDIRKLNDFGIGTYIRNLILNLAQLDHESDYFLISREPDRAEFSTLPGNFSFIVDPSLLPQKEEYWPAAYASLSGPSISELQIRDYYS